MLSEFSKDSLRLYRTLYDEVACGLVEVHPNGGGLAAPSCDFVDCVQVFPEVAGKDWLVMGNAIAKPADLIQIVVQGFSPGVDGKVRWGVREG